MFKCMRMFVLILVFFSEYNIFAVTAKSNVLIRNNTGMTFNTRIIPKDPSAKWHIYTEADVIGPWNKPTPKKDFVLEFERFTPKKKFTVEIRISTDKHEFPLYLEITGKGSLKKNLYSISGDNKTWVSGKDLQNFNTHKWKIGDKEINVMYRTYPVGMFYNVEVVLQDPTSYKIEDTQGKPNEINILAYNVFMLNPPFTSPDKLEDMKTRARIIPSFVKDFDVVIFSEAFYDDARKILLENMKLHGFNYSTCILGAGFKQYTKKASTSESRPQYFVQPYVVDFNLPRFQTDKEYASGSYGGHKLKLNGGVIIVSKFPIEWCGELIYSRSVSWDKMAQKGAVCAKINKKGFIYCVIGTHPQALYDDKGPTDPTVIAAKVAIKQQFKELTDFITNLNISNEYPVIIGGDLNVDKHGKSGEGEYENMLQALDLTVPDLQGDIIYSTPKSNYFRTEKTFLELLDYVAFVNGYNKPTESFNRILRFRNPTYKNVDLSDHDAVYGHFKFAKQIEEAKQTEVE